MKKFLLTVAAGAVIMAGCNAESNTPAANSEPAATSAKTPVMQNLKPKFPTTQEARPIIEKSIDVSTAEKGQKFGKMTFQSITNHVARFTGGVELKGTYSTSELDGYVYFQPDNDSLQKLPDPTIKSLSFTKQEKAQKLFRGTEGIALINISGYNLITIESSQPPFLDLEKVKILQ